MSAANRNPTTIKPATNAAISPGVKLPTESKIILKHDKY